MRGGDLYAVTLRHDGGRVTLTLAAGSADDAARRVCDIERAPLSAVLAVRQVSP